MFETESDKIRDQVKEGLSNLEAVIDKEVALITEMFSSTTEGFNSWTSPYRKKLLDFKYDMQKLRDKLQELDL